MTMDGNARKSAVPGRRHVARDFWIVQAGFGVLFLGLAWWLFIAKVGLWWRAVAGVLAMAGLFALIDVLNGPPAKTRR
jgi:hypothetical protein